MSSNGSNNGTSLEVIWLERDIQQCYKLDSFGRCKMVNFYWGFFLLELDHFLPVKALILLSSNIFFLLWASRRVPYKSSILMMLSISEISSIFLLCGSTFLCNPSLADSTLWICVFFPFLSLIGVTINLFTEIIDAMLSDNEEFIKTGFIPCLLRLLLPSFILSLAMSFLLRERIEYCLVQPSSVHCTIQASVNPLVDSLVQLALNPLRFPFTVNTVLPILLFLAKTTVLFPNVDHPKNTMIISWSIFIFIYSLFVWDLVSYSRSVMDSEMVVISRLDSLENIFGSMFRNVSAIIITILLGGWVMLMEPLF